MPIAAVQHKPAVQVLDNALFDIYDDLEDDEQRIAEQKKRREEEEQKRREEQDRLFNLHNDQAAYVPCSCNDHIREPEISEKNYFSSQASFLLITAYMTTNMLLI